jgi:MerR family transcriptional regulator, light-induced transcriptional regulator
VIDLTPQQVVDLARRYVEAVLSSEVRPGTPTRLIESALAQGWDPATLVVDVLPEALYQIGRKWQDGSVSVAEEHLTTYVVQDTLRELARRLPRSGHSHGSVVVAAVEGELHDLGARVLSDLLEADGWDVLHLGASTPAAALATLVDQRRPDAIALSATLTTNLAALRNAVEHLRAGAGRERFIIVGGQACAHIDDLAEKLGADACELRADRAVDLLQQAVAGR